VDFLRTLYQRCTHTSFVRPMTVSEYLERHPPQDILPRLFSGSWISHNFAIWIGHEEDNTAWDALHQTRQYLEARSAESPGDPLPDPAVDSSELTPLQRAWRELFIAEGSDWFWWFGDDHSSAQDALFDHLFRRHLQNVYQLLGDEPPAALVRPISRRGGMVQYTPPRSLLEVTIDGRYTFFEWLSAGHYTCHNERGTMAMAMQGPLRDVYFGFDLERLLIRVDCEGNAVDALAEYDTWRIGFIEPAGYEVRVSEPGRPGQKVSLWRNGQEVPASGLEAGVDRIAEAAIPFAVLGVEVHQPIQFHVELLQDGQSRDRAPRQWGILVTRPSPDFEQIMWNV
jgi:alpha-amylase/alpha-mannosidase (GH57 family)